MKKNKEQLGLEFWERMNTLIGDERPYSWAVRHDIPKGSFQSAYERKAKPLDKTLDKWAELIGVDAHWLKTGAYKVEPNDVSREWGITEVYPINGVHIEPSDYQQPEHIKDMNPTLLIEAMAMVEEVLTETGRTMEAMHKAELVLRVYELLALNPQPTTEFKDTLKRTLKIA